MASSALLVECLGFVVSAMLVAVPVDVLAPDTKLIASDGAAGDGFGVVSLSGDIAVIGAPRKDDLGIDSGVAYVFVRTGTTWSQEAKLLASDGAASDGFGIPSVDGDTAVVGAPGDEAGKGAAYVFRRSEGRWSQEAKLTTSDGSAGDRFGASVAIDGDTILIGARGVQNRTGAAYVFARDGGSWRQEARLGPTDGLPGDLFGTVSLRLDTAAIGAEGHGHERGAAYVFVRSDGGWSLQAKLTASDGIVEDEFGASVSLDNDTVVIGAPFANGVGVYCCKGAAYVFVREGTAWSEQARLTTNDAEPQDAFGAGLAVAGDFAWIGARDDDLGLNAGAAYVFARKGTTWIQAAKVLGRDGAPLDGFGSTVAVDGNTVIIGALGDDDRGPDSGSAYVFDLGPALDSTEPTLTIVSPIPGTTVTTAVVAVSGTAADDVAVRTVEISPDGITWTLASGTASWSGTVSLREGTNTISVRATDTSDNVAAKSIDVTVVLAIQPEGVPTWLPFAGGAVVLAVTVAWAIVWQSNRKRMQPPPR